MNQAPSTRALTSNHLNTNNFSQKEDIRNLLSPNYGVHTSVNQHGGDAPSEKIRRSDGVESDNTDTDYELESAVRHAMKKPKDRLTFEDLGASSIVSLLSPSVREVIKNVELVRLPLVALGSRKSKKAENDGRKELWPGVASGGAAVQCIHCHASERHVLSSLLTLWQHLGILSYNHFAHCQTIPIETKETLKTLTPKFNSTSFKVFQTELGLFCQHVSENLQRNSQLSSGVPLTQNHGGDLKEGSRVIDLEEILYQKGVAGKINITTKSISNSTYKSSEIPHYKMVGKNSLNVCDAPKTIIKKLQDKLSLQASKELRSKKVACAGKRHSKSKDKSFVYELKMVRYHKGKNGHIQFTCEEVNRPKRIRRTRIR